MPNLRVSVFQGAGGDKEVSEQVLNVLMGLVNTPPAWTAAVSLGGIYVALWKATDRKVRLRLIHTFLITFTGGIGWWAVEVAAMRVATLYNCFY